MVATKQITRIAWGHIVGIKREPESKKEYRCYLEWFQRRLASPSNTPPTQDKMAASQTTGQPHNLRQTLQFVFGRLLHDFWTELEN